jgi:hypothetical protein
MAFYEILWQLLEMPGTAGNGWKRLEMARIKKNSWNLLKKAEDVWEWQEPAGIAENGRKSLNFL